MPANNRNAAFNASFTHANNQKSQDNWLKYKARELVKVSDLARKGATSRRMVKFENSIKEANEEVTDEDDQKHQVKEIRPAPSISRKGTSVGRKGVLKNVFTVPDVQKEDDDDVINFIDNLDLENFIDNLEEKYQIGEGLINLSPVKIDSKKTKSKIEHLHLDQNPIKLIQNECNEAQTTFQANCNAPALKSFHQTQRVNPECDKENQSNFASDSRYHCLNSPFNLKAGPRAFNDKDSMQTSGIFNRTINEEELDQMSEPQVHKALSSLLFRRNAVS